jgi:hypothetical protein
MYMFYIPYYSVQCSFPICYRTVDKSTFLQVKNEDSAANVWKKVISIHADKGSLYETNLLTQLQTLRLVESGDMREHLTKMSEIKERLAEMNCPVTDESFVSYICTSLSLVPNYRSLLTTLNATAHESGRKLTSSNLIWHLTEEANSIALEDSINKSNAAMMAATSRSRGKANSKGKAKAHCLNPNCNKDGHTIDQCFTKGGGCKPDHTDSRHHDNTHAHTRPTRAPLRHARAPERAHTRHAHSPMATTEDM